MGCLAIYYCIRTHRVARPLVRAHEQSRENRCRKRIRYCYLPFNSIEDKNIYLSLEIRTGVSLWWCSPYELELLVNCRVADLPGPSQLTCCNGDRVPPQVTGTMNGHSTSHSVDTRKRLTPIPDINISGNHTPYKVQKAVVENTMVPCINAKPYQYTELLMTLPDLASHFFPRVSLTTCRAMLDALGLTLFRPNTAQLQVLRNSGKCKSAAENAMALVQIRDVMQHMLQFKYMIRSGLEEPHPPHQPRPAHAPPSSHAKRARAN